MRSARMPCDAMARPRSRSRSRSPSRPAPRQRPVWSVPASDRPLRQPIGGWGEPTNSRHPVRPPSSRYCDRHTSLSQPPPHTHNPEASPTKDAPALRMCMYAHGWIQRLLLAPKTRPPLHRSPRLAARLRSGGGAPSAPAPAAAAAAAATAAATAAAAAATVLAAAAAPAAALAARRCHLSEWARALQRRPSLRVRPRRRPPRWPHPPLCLARRPPRATSSSWCVCS